MAEIKSLLDEYGISHEASKILPDDLHKIKFLESLAEKTAIPDCRKV